MTDRLQSAASKLEEAIDMMLSSEVGDGQGAVDDWADELREHFSAMGFFGPPEEPYAWAVAAVWDTRRKLEGLAREVCLRRDEETLFALLSHAVELLDAALAAWGMQPSPEVPLAVLTDSAAVWRPTYPLSPRP